MNKILISNFHWISSINQSYYVWHNLYIYFQRDTLITTSDAYRLFFSSFFSLCLCLCLFIFAPLARIFLLHTLAAVHLADRRRFGNRPNAAR